MQPVNNLNLTILPEDVPSMFSNLDRKSLGRTAQVCKLWNARSSNDDSWGDVYFKMKLSQQFKGENVSLKNRVKEHFAKIPLALLHAKMKIQLNYPSTEYPLVSKELLTLLNSENFSKEEKVKSIKTYLDGLKTRSYDPIMHIFAESGGSEYVFELLLELGINLESTNEFSGTPDETPLARACYSTDTIRSRLLLQYGAKVTSEARGYSWGRKDIQQMLDGKGVPFEIPKLTGQEIDIKIVDILYAMPKHMRAEVLLQLRNRPDYKEICPALFRSKLHSEGLSILAEATRKYIASQV